LAADQVTDTPGSALPSASSTSTITESERGQPGVPDAVAGERRRISAGIGRVDVGSSPQAQTRASMESAAADFRPIDRASSTRALLRGRDPEHLLHWIAEEATGQAVYNRELRARP
jgi:hypothetical protein